MGLPQLEGSLGSINEFAGRLRDRIESTVGALAEFPKLAKDMSDNLGEFIKSIEEASKQMSVEDREKAEQFTEVLKEMRNRASQGQITGFGGSAYDQKMLLWQMVQLTKVMKERREQSAARVVDAARHEPAKGRPAARPEEPRGRSKKSGREKGEPKEDGGDELSRGPTE